MRHCLVTLFALLALSAAACTTSKPEPRPPGDVDGPVDCGKERFKAKEHCFDRAKQACDWLGCAHGCDILRARASKWVVCSANEASSSQLTKCEGFSNWQCPENMVCRNERAATCDDCAGTCAPIRP